MKKASQPTNIIRLGIVVVFCVVILIFGYLVSEFFVVSTTPVVVETTEDLMRESQIARLLVPATPTPKPTPVPTSYPPKGWACVNVPILMYHHVQPIADAKAAGHGALTVDSGVFAQQMEYIQKKGYTPIRLSQLADHFDTGVPLPVKPIIITFDDGYDDFYHHALPVLSSKNMTAELFVPTGLLENPGYLTWNQVKESSEKNIAISHHTWSHANMASRSDQAFFTQEIDVPSQQLAQRGFSPQTVFAYPYGTQSLASKKYLASKGFRIAVTTLSGETQCKEDRFALRRTRIGNGRLAEYGL